MAVLTLPLNVTLPTLDLTLERASVDMAAHPRTHSDRVRLARAAQAAADDDASCGGDDDDPVRSGAVAPPAADAAADEAAWPLVKVSTDDVARKDLVA